ncbi:AAA family ATPase [uncultured Sutterella sp.]|uniref:AAA family ATPase n=1 Tax=uncultured Sutterella sp. TaxID=286133 RepID=UPI002601684E|nr:AAA family ATPase [uncultured Sutterella sp.]
MFSHSEPGKLTRCGKKSGSQDVEFIARLWMARLYVEGDAWEVIDITDVMTDDPWNKAFRAEVKAYMWAVKHPQEGTTPEECLRLGLEHSSEMNYGAFNSADFCPNRACGIWFKTVREKLGFERPDVCPQSLRDELNAREAEYSAGKENALPEPLRSNIRAFRDAFGLTEDESNALAFLLLVRIFQPLQEFLYKFNFAAGGARLLSEVLSVAFRKEMSEQLFSSEGTLMRTGLLSLRDATDDSLDMRFDLLGNDQESTRLMNERISPEAFFSTRISRTPPSNLAIDDYSHIPAVRELLIPYLGEVLKTRKQGVNILIYGPPGTGKTELVRAAADALGARLYEIEPLREREKEEKAHSRISRWNIAEKLYRTAENTLLVIDESEDIINEGAVFTLFGGLKRTNKAELNKLVETAPVPTFWLTNSLMGMDPALIRRFDILLEVPVPPEKVRRQIAGKAFGELLSAGMLDRLAMSDRISPAVISRTASVIRDLKLVEEKNRDAACETLLSATLDAQSLGKLPGKVDALPVFYDTRFVNTTANLSQICEGLKRCGAGRLCLYGPPGTGKTAYVRWLARELGMPLIAKRASDLLNMFVGGTEALIREAFEEAKRAGALLLIDEADSFLRDRELSQRSWEVTQVNELLTQMESFPGIFCATTNLFENIDRAALRRFDLKAKFDFLRPEQRLGLFERHLAALGLGAKDVKGLEARLSALDCITPGDFAAIERGSAFSPIQSAEEFLSRLESDAALKTEGRKKPRIGF